MCSAGGVVPTGSTSLTLFYASLGNTPARARLPGVVLYRWNGSTLMSPYPTQK